MPRVSAAPKRPPGAANHRDTRHESGLVGPGKKVVKQKSNGHLNGTARSQDSPAVPAIPSSAMPVTLPQANGHVRPSANLETHLADAKMAGVPRHESMRQAEMDGYTDSSSSESYHVSHENHRRIDVNAAKNPAVHRDLGPLNLALTVLRSCPLYDTIAILIVLLQIPPTFLSIIHLLFASLTFVPPSASTNSGLSFTDIFEGTVGTPSVATIVVVDLLVLLVWLFLWTPLQNIALDLAQTVIALTLGGGSSGREAGMHNVVVCFGIIGMSHLARSGNIKQSGLRAILASSTGGILGSPDPDDPLEPITRHVTSKDAHGWIRSILAIHILAQGFVRYIREWYVRREKRDSSASTIGDPEAGPGLAETNVESTTSSLQMDTDSSNTLPVSNTVVTTKKKRKQSAQVRIQQPLWAALASTKIVMVKEYETSHAAAESAGTNATDINNLGNAPFSTEADRIWITYVGSDEVFFSSSYFPAYSSPHECEDMSSMCSGGVDRSKPFYVRVNNTAWQPTRITFAESGQPLGQDSRWTGEIFGLAPISSYQCDFVSTTDGSIIFSTSVRTLPAPVTNVAVSTGLVPNTAGAGRPGSPISTLKASIATSEVKLNEERSRQKRDRNDQKKKLAAARKEIDALMLKVTSGGNNDDRQRQKAQQNTLHTKQAEEAIIALAAEIEQFNNIPYDSPKYDASQSVYMAEKDVHKETLEEFDNTKKDVDCDIQALTDEVATLKQKREKLQSRFTKLNGEHERITEIQRKEQDRQDRQAERASKDMLLQERIQGLKTEIENMTMSLHALYTVIEAQAQQGVFQQAESFAQQQAAQKSPLNAGLVPEYTELPEPIMAPAAYPWNPSMTGMYAGFPGSNILSTSHRTRGRSSSMLSNVSGFTQDSTEGKAAVPNFSNGNGYTNGHAMRQAFAALDRKASVASRSGSGSGDSSGSLNGSNSDPKSPTPIKPTVMAAGHPQHGRWDSHGGLWEEKARAGATV